MKRLSRIALLAALLLSAVIGIVIAESYLRYTFNISATITEPKVKFFKWADQTTSTTFTYTCNIYKEIERFDTNITHAIYNTDTASEKVKIRIKSISSTTVVSNVTVAIYNADGTTILDSVTWTTGGDVPTDWTSDISLAASTKHPMGIFLTGAAASGSTTIEMEMESPG